MYHYKTAYLWICTLIFCFDNSSLTGDWGFPKTVPDRRGELKCVIFPSKNSAMSMVPVVAVARTPRLRAGPVTRRHRLRPAVAAPRVSPRASPRAKASPRVAAAATAKPIAANQQHPGQLPGSKTRGAIAPRVFLCIAVKPAKTKI